jgi:hypothetical protein
MQGTAALHSEGPSSAGRERPILFSGPMVRALLDGRKTQTRRAVRGAPVHVLPFIGRDDRPTGEFGLCLTYDRVIDRHILCPYGQPGDRLWVREAWVHYQTVNHRRRPDGGSFAEASDGLAGYRADGHDTTEDFRNHIRLMSGVDLEAIEINGDRWRPSIHMPRWASRITLEVTEVRVQRLNDIDDSDAMAEGIGLARGVGWCIDGEEDSFTTARLAYRALWERINGPASWDANPWVWAVSFRREEAALLSAPHSNSGRNT